LTECPTEDPGLDDQRVGAQIEVSIRATEEHANSCVAALVRRYHAAAKARLQGSLTRGWQARLAWKDGPARGQDQPAIGIASSGRADNGRDGCDGDGMGGWERGEKVTRRRGSEEKRREEVKMQKR
jgi:hypothetical protein